MKNLCLLGILLCTVITTSAQKQIPANVQPTKVHEPVNPQKDKREMEGLSVHLKEASGNTYLFDITKDGKPVTLMMNNPFTMRSEGFDKKEDAFKLAGWLVREYKMKGYFPPVIPPHVALELKIPLHRPPQNPHIPNTNSPKPANKPN